MYESFFVQDPLGEGEVEVVKNSFLFGKEQPPRRGKVRDIYDLGNKLLIFASDRISAFDKVFPSLIPHKGASLQSLSIFWFEKTRNIFPNHFIKSIDFRTMEVVKTDRIDIEWVVRGNIYGSAWRRYLKGERVISGVRFPSGLRLAEELPEVVLTPTTKSDVGHDVEITMNQAVSKKLVTIEEWKKLRETTFKLYEFYRDYAKARRIIIPDFKLEYGKIDGELIQIDEPPTHDSARFWAEKYYEVGKHQETHCLDKEFLRSYSIKTGFKGEFNPPELPLAVINEISKRCVGSYKVFSNKSEIDDLGLRSVDDIFQRLC